MQFSIGFGGTWENFEMCMFVRLARRNSFLTRSAPRNRRKQALREEGKVLVYFVGK